MNLNDVEVAALRAIAEEYPETQSHLAALFRSCVVTKRENTGGGFFTTLAPGAGKIPPVSLRSPLGDAYISVEGLRVGICCLVFLTDGYPTLLEGYSIAGEDTSNIDFGTVPFTVRVGAMRLET